MFELIKAAAVFFLLVFSMFCMGSYVTGFSKDLKFSFGRTLISGFIAYFFLFEFFAFPMMVMKQPLSSLTILWCMVLLVLMAVACFRFGKIWIRQWKENKHRRYSPFFYLMLLLIAGQCLFVALWTDNSPDAAYYVANVSANVATNTINIYEPFTGTMQEQFYVRYLFGLYPVHNAVVSQAFKVHPLLLTKTVMSVFTILMSYLIYAQIGKKLFPEKRENVWKLLCFLSVIQFFFHTIYSNSSFLLTRGYEGKAMLANLVLPSVLYFGICLYEKIDDKAVWLMLFCAGVAGVDISMSGMSIVPVAVSAVCLPVILQRRAWKKIGLYLVCMIPSIMILAVYLLASKGYLVFSI